MQLIYISHGTIPSTGANTIQTMKMSQGFGSVVDDFELVISKSLFQFGQARKFDLFEWYGISDPIRIRKIPTCLAIRDPMSMRIRSRRFAWIASQYALYCKTKVVFTRNAGVALRVMNAGIPVIFETHYPIKPELKSAQQISEHPNLRGVVTIAPVITQSYVDFGVEQNKVLELPDGVDLCRFSSVQKNSDLNRRIKAFHAGSIGPNRGIELIFDLAEKFPEVDFEFAGGNPVQIAGRLKEATQRGLQNCKFLGFVANSNLPQLLVDADVLLMPYSKSIFSAKWMSPMKMFEYMASGNVILGSRLPVIETVLLHKKNAWLAEPDDLESYESGLRELIDKPQVRKQLGDSARQCVEEYTWLKRAQEIVNNFEVGR